MSTHRYSHSYSADLSNLRFPSADRCPIHSRKAKEENKKNVIKLFAVHVLKGKYFVDIIVLLHTFNVWQTHLMFSGDILGMSKLMAL